MKLYLGILIFIFSSSAFSHPENQHSENQNGSEVDVHASRHPNIVERNLANTDLPCRSLPNYVFCGEQSHFKVYETWLSEVLKTDVGVKIIEDLSHGSHELMIMHHPSSVLTAGKTLIELTTRMSNGHGTPAVIQMNFEMPDHGSHRVATYGTSELIEFTADQNLFHEFVHAKHAVYGTMATMYEVQAILEENIYREQKARLQGLEQVPLRNYRAYEDGQQIWFEPTSQEYTGV